MRGMGAVTRGGNGGRAGSVGSSARSEIARSRSYSRRASPAPAAAAARLARLARLAAVTTASPRRAGEGTPGRAGDARAAAGGVRGESEDASEGYAEVARASGDVIRPASARRRGVTTGPEGRAGVCVTAVVRFFDASSRQRQHSRAAPRLSACVVARRPPSAHRSARGAVAAARWRRRGVPRRVPRGRVGRRRGVEERGVVLVALLVRPGGRARGRDPDRG